MRVAVAAVLALTCQLALANPPGLVPSAPPGLTPVSPTSPASATAASAPAPEKRVASYRAQTLAADGIAVGLLLLAAETDDRGRGEDLAKLSLATYALGAPVVHMSKGRGGRALLSVTMRVGFPVIGSMLFDSLRPRSKSDHDDYVVHDSGPTQEMVLGIIGGVLAASIVDAAVLAKGDPSKAERAPGWAPTARATQGGFAVGVHAAF